MRTGRWVELEREIRKKALYSEMMCAENAKTHFRIILSSTSVVMIDED